jgi:hypothetical protein
MAIESSLQAKPEAAMSSRTVFLGRLLGLLFLLDGLAMLVHKQSMVETAAALVHDRALMLLFGMIALVVGLAMVLGHNVWSGGALPVIVTLLGWIFAIRGVILLFLPPETVAGLFDTMRFEQLFYFFAGITLVLGLYLTYAGFTASPPASAGAKS